MAYFCQRSRKLNPSDGNSEPLVGHMLNCLKFAMVRVTAAAVIFGAWLLPVLALV
jgi:hypothetical protein